MNFWVSNTFDHQDLNKIRIQILYDLHVRDLISPIWQRFPVHSFYMGFSENSKYENRDKKCDIDEENHPKLCLCIPGRQTLGS